jgi:hypothetical protein
MKVTPAVDKVIDHFYWDITKPYWDKQRDYVDEEYRTIPFPFGEIPAPKFFIRKQLSLQAFLGYLRTWSGVKHYMAKEHIDPLSLVMPDLENAWGNYDTHEITWPVHVRAGYVQ